MRLQALYGRSVTLLKAPRNASGIGFHGYSALIAVSGFTRDELIGEPHNLIRQPDMPRAAEALYARIRTGESRAFKLHRGVIVRTESHTKSTRKN